MSPNSRLYSGAWDQTAIASADIIIASPGVDINDNAIADFVREDAELLGDVELYCRVNNTPRLAVTGSNGKSTVVSLLAHIAKYSGIDAKLAGNIGVPVLDIANDSSDVVILELSSFQLETMTSLDAIAGTVLNICDDHLDRHKTLANYQAIKKRIYSQSKRRVINRDQALSKPKQAKDNDVSFGLGEPEIGHFGIRTVDDVEYLAFGEQLLVACQKLPIAGKHNELNCLAALALGYCAGWPLDTIAQGLVSFEGLDHRCKQVKTADDIVWINDSKATNIGATLAAIEGLARAHYKLILIAGGDGKGADFNELKPAMDKVDELITSG